MFDVRTLPTATAHYPATISDTPIFNALAATSPTLPLPEEYPTEKAFITVTFFYNETPPTYNGQ